VRGLDPIARTNPAEDTVSWRDNRPRRPESQILGAAYACIDLSHAPLVVADSSSWLVRGLGLHRGEQFPQMVGNEADGVTLSLPTPRPLDIVFHSPIHCGRSGFADTAYYTSVSGAGVFDAGTLEWECALAARHAPGGCDPIHDNPHGDLLVQQITARLLRAFVAGPAGVLHPAVDNLARLGLRDHVHHHA
jgi:hypothetical protein